MKVTVNGETIPQEMIQQEVQRYRQQNLGTNEKEAFEAVSRNMIEWALIRQNAEKRGVSVSPEEIEEGFEQLCRSHGGKEQFFQRFSLTEENTTDIKRDVERNRRITKFLDGLSKDAPTPSEEAVAAFYEKNRQNFMHPEKVHAAHIVKHPQGEPAEREAAAALTATRGRLLAGEDFMTVANETSECHDTAPDLGEFARGQMVPEFELVVFSMNVGEISPVFKSQFGLHIATVLGKTESKPMNLDECRCRIEEQLSHDAKNDAIAAWVDAEKERAEIQITDE
ncbi:MAG: peptidyl-prolyl cis-trans isomerase [Kiritimatiellales bacterium]